MVENRPREMPLSRKFWRESEERRSNERQRQRERKKKRERTEDRCVHVREVNGGIRNGLRAATFFKRTSKFGSLPFCFAPIRGY